MRGASRWSAAALLVLAAVTGFSFWAQWHDAHRMPPKALVRAANAQAAAQWQPGDAVRPRPVWFDDALLGWDRKPILYGMNLDPYDRHLYKRLWLVYATSHASEAAVDRAEWMADSQVVFDDPGYRIEVGTVRQAERVWWDGYTEVEHAEVAQEDPKLIKRTPCSNWNRNRWSCGATDPFIFVGPVVREMDDTFRSCVAANPPPGKKAWSIHWAGVPMGRSFRIKAGITYFAHRMPRGSAVQMEVKLNGQIRLKRRFEPHEVAYPEFVISTVSEAGSEGDVEVRVWADDSMDRFFCFRPQTLSPLGGGR